MQLTKQTDFAFRVLITLATKPEAQTITIAQIAERFAISRSHLMKVVQKLAQAGLVHSVRGAKGGLLLGRAAQSINLREVVELMEPNMQPINCQQPRCLLARNCLLQGYLIQAQQQFLQHLAKFSLADAINTQTQQVIFCDKPILGGADV